MILDHKTKQDTISKRDTIIMKMEQQALKVEDSLVIFRRGVKAHREHLSTCSFIASNQFYVDAYRNLKVLRPTRQITSK